MTPLTKYQHGQYVKRFEAFVTRPALAALPFEAQVRDFLDHLPPSSRFQARSALKMAHPTAMDWSALRVRKPKRNEARLQRTIFSGDEWAQLGAILATRPREKALVYVLATLRRCEAATLRWKIGIALRALSRSTRAKGACPGRRCCSRAPSRRSRPGTRPAGGRLGASCFRMPGQALAAPCGPRDR